MHPYLLTLPSGEVCCGPRNRPRYKQIQTSKCQYMYPYLHKITTQHYHQVKFAVVLVTGRDVVNRKVPGRSWEVKYVHWNLEISFLKLWNFYWNLCRVEISFLNLLNFYWNLEMVSIFRSLKICAGMDCLPLFSIKIVFTKWHHIWCHVKRTTLMYKVLLSTLYNGSLYLSVM